ncbi:MAG: hypothetical protein IKE55_06840 [Kiritimatiellae bacterium]|nr:hypothetical protein [Kiritimatiellia bacterium]
MQKNMVLLSMALFAAASASAFTIYDAGKALHANITSSVPVGADGSTYTDAQGGKWQYLRANDKDASTTVAFEKSVASGSYYRGIGGNSSASGSPYIHVNVSGVATMTSVSGGTAVEADELYVHPGNPSSANHYVVVRFIVPEDGWYSAFVTAHDLNDNGTANSQAGAEVRLLANNVLQAHGVVVLEDYTGTTPSGGTQTKRFDFQMPVRWMSANETIDFMVGANGANQSDATGMKAFVTREDEGAFYDSGLAMTNNVLGSSFNPFGTTALGMWYYCYVDTSAPRYDAQTEAACSADYFANWTPGNLTKKLKLLDQSYTRTSPPLLKGFFMSTRVGSSPYICVNHTAACTNDVAPQELYTHPHAENWTDWTTLRFRPPRAGLYSASVVLRDVSRDTGNVLSDGVMAYLLVSEKVVTNAVVCARRRTPQRTSRSKPASWRQTSQSTSSSPRTTDILATRRRFLRFSAARRTPTMRRIRWPCLIGRMRLGPRIPLPMRLAASRSGTLEPAQSHRGSRSRPCPTPSCESTMESTSSVTDKTLRTAGCRAS